MRRPGHITRARRAQIRDEAHQRYIVGRTQNLDADAIQGELLAAFPDELAPGEARLYAMGWTVRVVREGLRGLGAKDGLDASGVGDGEVWRWLRGEVRPTIWMGPLCRLFCCHQSRLGWPAQGNETPVDHSGDERNAGAIAPSIGMSTPQDRPAVANDPLAHEWPTPQIKLQLPAHYSSHSSAMQTFREADRQVGGGELYPAVLQYLQATVAPHLFGVVVGADAKAVFTAAAALTEMAGWMAYDTGQPVLAKQHFNRALDLSRIGGDRQLSAHVLASLSHLASHLRRPDEAIRLSRAGRGALPSRLRPPELEARLLAMEARGFAALGDAIETGALLDRAEQALHRAYAMESSHWISHFDDASLATEGARCMQRLHRFADAERYARRVITLRSADRTRSRAFGQLILVSMLVAQGRQDEGCAVAHNVIDATESLGSVLVLDQLRELQDVFKPHRGDRVVAELLDRLATVLPERGRRYPWISGSHDGRVVPTDT
jgi:hypothetical protein